MNDSNSSEQAALFNSTLELNILSLLRERTRTSHQNLEKSDINRQLMDNRLPINRYVEVVYAYHGAFTILEQLLNKAYKEGKYYQKPDDRSSLAQNDINDLSEFFREEYLLPYKDLLPIDWGISLNMPQALGISYVLEGSKLGGKLIKQQLARSLGVTPEQGCAFFSANGGVGLTGWKTFQVECLDYASNFPDHNGVIVQSANATFEFMTHYFGRFCETFPFTFSE